MNLRRFTKPAIYSLITLTVAAAVSMAGYEVFLHRQADVARADRLTRAQIEAAMAAIYPDLPSADESPRPLPVDDAATIESLIEPARRAAFPYEGGKTARLDFDIVARLSDDELNMNHEPKDRADALVMSAAVLDALLADGLDRKLDALAARSPVRPTALIQPIRSRYRPPFAFHPAYAPFRTLFSINRARMRLATRSDDPAPFAQALATHIGLLQHISFIADDVAAIQSREEHSRALDLAARALYQHRNRAWLDAIEKATSIQPRFASNADIEYVADLAARDRIAEFFSDVSLVRLTNRSRFQQYHDDALPQLWIGTYRGSLDEYASLREAWAPSLKMDRFRHPGGIGAIPRHAAVYLAGSAKIWWLWHTAEPLAHARSFQLHLAIERFLLDHGELPNTLEQLIPKYIEAIPIDPLSEQPLRYSRLFAPGELHSYTIYSPSPGGIDDIASAGAEPLPLDQLDRIKATPLIVMPPTLPPRQ